ncbi:MAG: hypothetical protein ABFR95_06175 [Actinomycetota bacterium]
MGQRIDIEDSRVVDDSVIVTTNRTLTGADGEGFASSEEASAGDTFGAGLASDLFESDERVDRVYVASNVVTIRRNDGWDDSAVGSVSEVISDFLLHY